MPEYESPRVRYRFLAEEALEVASTFPPGEQRDTMLQMAQVWQRLAHQSEASTPPFPKIDTAEPPVVQQQQQVQPDDDKKK
jgi:hypothetical protein